MQLIYILQPTLNYRNAVIPEHWMTYERSILLHTPPDSMGLEHSAFKGVKHSHGNLHTKYNSIQKCVDARASGCDGFHFARAHGVCPDISFVALAAMTCGYFRGQRNSSHATPSRSSPLATLLLLNLGRGPLITIILAGVASNT